MYIKLFNEVPRGIYIMSDHSNHMCELVRHMRAEEFIPLVKDAKWVCEVCGRVAKDKANLCRPIPLE